MGFLEWIERYVTGSSWIHAWFSCLFLGSPMASAPFWIALICQIVIVIGYFWFYRKEQLSRPWLFPFGFCPRISLACNGHRLHIRHFFQYWYIDFTNFLFCFSGNNGPLLQLPQTTSSLFLSFQLYLHIHYTCNIVSELQPQWSTVAKRWITTIINEVSYN